MQRRLNSTIKKKSARLPGQIAQRAMMMTAVMNGVTMTVSTIMTTVSTVSTSATVVIDRRAPNPVVATPLT